MNTYAAATIASKVPGGDIVNAYFKRFYPADAATSWETRALGSFCGREYIGDRVAAHSAIFPPIVCADGLTLSVQGHFGAYSYPRDDFADKYEQVEIMGKKKADELLAPYERDCNSVGDEMIYPYVPTAVIVAVIEKHGGIKGAYVYPEAR